MRSWLVLNTPWQGTGNRHEWSFSGADDAALRACLDQLDRYAAPDPDDRWTAAIVLGLSDPARPAVAQAAWTIDGALLLADVLPQELGDLRDDLRQSFAARAVGRLGDAHTPRTSFATNLDAP